MDDTQTRSAGTPDGDGPRDPGTGALRGVASAPHDERRDVGAGDTVPRDADAREAMSRLGLRARPGPATSSGWRAADADGAEYCLTALAIESPEHWDLVRMRTTALLALEHENVVPLVGAMPVGDPAQPAPRTLLLVWPGGEVTPARAARAEDEPAAAFGSIIEALDVLVAACRAGVALRSCGTAVPGAAIVDALVACAGEPSSAGTDPRVTTPPADPRSRLRVHPEPWCGAPDEPALPAHDLTREVAAAIRHEVERAGLDVPAGVRNLLADGSGLAAPAPGDLAARALDLRERVLGDGSPPLPGPTTTHTQVVPETLPAGGHLDWRALVRDAGAPTVSPPPQARLTTRRRPPPTRTVIAAPGGQGREQRGSSRSPGADVLGSASGPRARGAALPRGRRPVRELRMPPGAARSGPLGELGRARPDAAARVHGPRDASRRGRVLRLAVVAVLLTGGGVGAARVAVDASHRDVTTGGHADAATARSRVSPDDVAGPATSPGRSPMPTGGPAEVARRATVERVEILAAIEAVAEPSREAVLEEVAARLATFVAPGPVHDADLALVGQVLRGETTVPSVRADVSAADVVRHDATSADVLVTYSLEPDGEALRHTLGLVHDGGVWKVASVIPVAEEP